VDHDAFVRLMQTIADGWNTGDTERALASFADDAVYVEPPDEQRYRGSRGALRLLRRAGPAPDADGVAPPRRRR